MINTRKDSWKRGASRSTAKRRPVGGGERFRPTSLTPPAASKGELCWTVSTLCVLDGRNIFPYTLLHYCCCLLYRSQYSYFSSSYAFAFTGYGPPDAEGSVHTVKTVLYRATCDIGSQNLRLELVTTATRLYRVLRYPVAYLYRMK